MSDFDPSDPGTFCVDYVPPETFAVTTEALERAWTQADEHLRAQGLDPAEMLARAAANMEAWRALPQDQWPPECFVVPEDEV